MIDNNVPQACLVKNRGKCFWIWRWCLRSIPTSTCNTRSRRKQIQRIYWSFIDHLNCTSIIGWKLLDCAPCSDCQYSIIEHSNHNTIHLDFHRVCCWSGRVKISTDVIQACRGYGIIQDFRIKWSRILSIKIAISAEKIHPWSIDIAIKILTVGPRESSNHSVVLIDVYRVGIWRYCTFINSIVDPCGIGK